MDFIISRRLSSGRYYAYYKNRFWFWDDTRNVWTESHLMSQKYEREHAARATLTPEDFMSDLTKFLPLDEYELDSVMADALKDAKPCKTAPIEPVKEESECTTMDSAAPSENADASSAIGGAHSSTGTGSMTEPVHSAPPDKPLTFIPENKTPEFDCSGLDKQTVENLHFAEDEYRHGKQMAERGLVHMGNAIAAAHDALCGVFAQCDNSEDGACRTMRKARNNQRSDDTFKSWCLSIGITKDTAYRLLQVSALMDGSNPRQQAILKTLPPTLLYAVAKPSAPQELVEQVKNGEITTNKEYQELLGQLKAKETELNETSARLKNACIQEQESRAAMDAANARAQEAESHYKAALADLNGLTEQNTQLKEQVDAAEAREEEAWKMQSKAEQRAKEAEAALKKQPITAVVDEEEVDRRAHQQAYAIAADMTEELKTDRDRLQENNASLQKQLAEAQAVSAWDPQEDIEHADGSRLNIDGIWATARPAFDRLVGTGDDFNKVAGPLIELCGRIKDDLIQMTIQNDKEARYE